MSAQIHPRLSTTLPFCIVGTYTAFSTFSLDCYHLIESGEAAAARTYMIGSVILWVSALIAAMLVVRALQISPSPILTRAFLNPPAGSSVDDPAGTKSRRWVEINDGLTHYSRGLTAAIALNLRKRKLTKNGQAPQSAQSYSR